MHFRLIQVYPSFSSIFLVSKNYISKVGGSKKPFKKAKKELWTKCLADMQNPNNQSCAAEPHLKRVTHEVRQNNQDPTGYRGERRSIRSKEEETAPRAPFFMEMSNAVTDAL